MVGLIYYGRNKIKTLILPGSWEELSTKQYINIAQLVHSNIDDIDVASDKLLKILLGKNLITFLLIPAAVRMRCYEHIQWVFEEQNCTKQLIPKYKSFYGPESEFDNLIFAEFHHAEMAYYNWRIDKDDDALDELVAILYREGKKEPYDKKRNPEGDIRIKFSYGDIAFHKKQVRKWKPKVKLAIVLWYDACREELRKLYPTAFNAGTTAADNYYDGLYKVIRNIAADGKHGIFEQVELMNVHNGFKEIVEAIEEDKELQRRLKQQRV
jgi:hypothetical protein